MTLDPRQRRGKPPGLTNLDPTWFIVIEFALCEIPHVFKENNLVAHILIYEMDILSLIKIHSVLDTNFLSKVESSKKYFE